MSQAMSQIGLTSEQQSQASVEMAQHINVISESAENTHQLSDAILKATGHIGQKSEALNLEAGKFKIDDTTFQLEQAKSAHLAWRSKLMSF